MSDWLSQMTCSNCLDCAACGGGARDVAEMCDESDKLAELMAANLELAAERDELRATLAESEYALNQSESTLERVREMLSEPSLGRFDMHDSRCGARMEPHAAGDWLFFDDVEELLERLTQGSSG